MSDFTDEQLAVVELTRIAQMYMRRGDRQKAEEVMTLVADIQRRVERERSQQNETVSS